MRNTIGELGMDQTTFRILDILSREIGHPISINELTNKIGRSYGTAHYSNIYEKIRSLTKEEITILETAGKSSNTTLNLENPFTNDLLTEIDLRKKQELLRKKPQLQMLLTSIYASLSNYNSIRSMSLINPERNIKLNKAEFLIQLHFTKGEINHTLEEILSIHLIIHTLQRRYNIRIDPLILPSDEFLILLKSKEANPLKEMLSDRISFFSPQSFWMEIMIAAEEGLRIRYERKETEPSEVSEDDLIYNLGRFGYREIGPQIIKGRDICLEYIITSILMKGDARRIEAIPILLAKNQPNYNILTYLSQRYGTSGKLLGLLRTLSSILPSDQIQNAIKIFETLEIDMIEIDQQSIQEKLRLYLPA